MIPKSLVTDTHPLLNYFSNKTKRLSRKARLAFDAAMSGDVTIHVPVYVIIETSQLRKKGRLTLSVPLKEWVADIFSAQSFVLVHLDATIALKYDDMSFTTDPADAFIVATALQLGFPLITNDSHIHATKPCLLYWD